MRLALRMNLNGYLPFKNKTQRCFSSQKNIGRDVPQERSDEDCLSRLMLQDYDLRRTAKQMKQSINDEALSRRFRHLRQCQ